MKTFYVFNAFHPLRLYFGLLGEYLTPISRKYTKNLESAAVYLFT